MSVRHFYSDGPHHARYGLRPTAAREWRVAGAQGSLQAEAQPRTAGPRVAADRCTSTTRTLQKPQQHDGREGPSALWRLRNGRAQSARTGVCRRRCSGRFIQHATPTWAESSPPLSQPADDCKGGARWKASASARSAALSPWPCSCLRRSCNAALACPRARPCQPPHLSREHGRCHMSLKRSRGGTIMIR